ncbi:MAG TPA: ATP-binding protein [Anaeromyxobacter sp.]
MEPGGISPERTGASGTTEGRSVPEEQYRVVLEAAGHICFEYDPRSARIVAGKPWTILGYGSDERSPSIDAWMELVHPEDRAGLLEGMRRQHQEGAPTHRIEYRMRAKDGAWRAVLISSRALARDPDGLPIRTSCTITDVTDARALRERVAYADRLSSLGSLAAGVAHAVNNPLVSVSAGLRMLQEELDRGAANPARLGERLPELRQAIADATQGADRVRDVVRGLQLFSAPRAGGVREAVDPRAELGAALDLTRNAVSQRARLTVDLGADLPRVLAVPGELGQAFVNLLMNASDAIPEGHAAEHDVRVVARTSAGRVFVEVTDTGVEIRPERLPKLFEPYSPRGTSIAPGLGLSVCHGVVTAAGGTLDVVSAPGRGSTFRVSLPAAPVPVPAVTHTIAAPRGRVLVIDDDPLVGRSMARLLQGAYEVTVLTSPVEAVSRLARGERWDAILCDLMMPELSGMDVEERLSKAAPDVVPRITYLTGGAFTDRARQFLAAGRPYLEKPVEADAIRARVAALVKR